MFNKELFEKKITILDKTIDKILDKANIPADFTGNIAVISFNTPKVAARARKRFPKAKVYFIEESALKCLFGLSGLYYNDEGELIKMLKNLEQDGLYVIANVPYGKIGANITKAIIDSVEFREYVNLLPANDCKRNDDKNLYNYQSDMEAIKDGFADAAVTTHVARIHKTEVNNMTLDEFERSNYIDPQLDKYFAENSKRTHYAISKPKELHNVDNPDISKIIYIAHRDINHKHFPYTRDSQANFINLNLGDYKTVCEKFVMKSAKEKGEIYFLGNCYIFNTANEKTNLSRFIYSPNGFKFCSKIFTAMNVDGRQSIKNVMPKVDWTRSWTVEEILADYGYTETEIKAVMDDLKNFKGMDK